MDSTDLRQRLLHALEAIELAKPPSFRAAFDFLAVFLPGAKPTYDQEVAEAFRRVILVIEAGSADPNWARHEKLADEGKKTN